MREVVEEVEEIAKGILGEVELELEAVDEAAGEAAIQLKKQ